MHSSSFLLLLSSGLTALAAPAVAPVERRQFDFFKLPSSGSTGSSSPSLFSGLGGLGGLSGLGGFGNLGGGGSAATTTPSAPTTTTTRVTGTTPSNPPTTTKPTTTVAAASTSSRATSTPSSTGTGTGSSTGSTNNANTRNDLVNGACKAITVIFARGTGESGNVGSATGPPFFTALNNKFGAANVAVQGIDYAATTAGFAGDSAGNAKMASLTKQAATQCPQTQIVLSGYSQGAMIIHNGAPQLDAATAARVAAVVLFGDPYQGRAFSNIGADKVKSFCHDGDSVCQSPGSSSITQAHLTYNQDAAAAADFVAGKVTG